MTQTLPPMASTQLSGVIASFCREIFPNDQFCRQIYGVFAQFSADRTVLFSLASFDVQAAAAAGAAALISVACLLSGIAVARTAPAAQGGSASAPLSGVLSCRNGFGS